MNTKPTFLIFVSFFWLNEVVYKSDTHKSSKPSFTNIRGLSSGVTGCEFFLELKSSNILALRVTNLEDSVDMSNFFVRGYLYLLSLFTMILSLICMILQFM